MNHFEELKIVIIPSMAFTDCGQRKTWIFLRYYKDLRKKLFQFPSVYFKLILYILHFLLLLIGCFISLNQIDGKDLSLITCVQGRTLLFFQKFRPSLLHSALCTRGVGCVLYQFVLGNALLLRNACRSVFLYCSESS